MLPLVVAILFVLVLAVPSLFAFSVRPGSMYAPALMALARFGIRCYCTKEQYLCFVGSM